MKNQLQIFLYLTIASTTLFCVCEAPHRNPFDPLNPHFDWASLSGRIRSAADPMQVIRGAKIFLPAQNRMTVSDSSGQFSFAHLLPQNGMLFISKENFFEDSVFIDWSKGLAQEIDIFLQPLPTISGKVLTLKSPPRPIAGVKVTWQPANIYTFTDDGGRYHFNRSTAGVGNLIFEKKGYKTIYQKIDFNGRESITQDVFLNALPILYGFKVYSVVENYYGSRRLFHLEVEAKVIDAENDIDSVYIASSLNSFRAELPYDFSAKIFRKSFSLSELGLNSLAQCVGHDFQLYVVDQEGDNHLLGVERVERVILDEIELTSPINGEIVYPPFPLRWLPFTPGFSFSFSVEIYTNSDFIPQLKYSRKGISSDSLAHTVSAALPPGEYVWMVWCIDEFGNSARSKPGSFSIAEMP
ncbi:MAG: carboxypeptidase-like regulatory domain-containing protein [candidate division KSB1 bacterium]|nr:carboxypeptidase-like regulatory domain-containing protein [candidate division KSB1 bacterium]MDZ7346136.1 carboxypeptidase-like regulatory domain-containing protein [candidate division KSB1 bacterium]